MADLKSKFILAALCGANCWRLGSATGEQLVAAGQHLRGSSQVVDNYAVVLPSLVVALALCFLGVLRLWRCSPKTRSQDGLIVGSKIRPDSSSCDTQVAQPFEQVRQIPEQASLETDVIVPVQQEEHAESCKAVVVNEKTTKRSLLKAKRQQAKTDVYHLSMVAKAMYGSNASLETLPIGIYYTIASYVCHSKSKRTPLEP